MYIYKIERAIKEKLENVLKALTFASRMNYTTSLQINEKKEARGIVSRMPLNFKCDAMSNRYFQQHNCVRKSVDKW